MGKVEFKSEKPLRILFIDYFSNIGGGQKNLLGILERLNLERIQPFFVCSQEGEMTDEVRNLNIPVFILNMGKGKMRDIFCSLPLLYGLRKFLIKNKIDIIFANSFLAGKFAGIVGKLCGVKSVLHKQSMIKKRKYSSSLLFFRFYLKFISRVLAVSYAVRESLLRVNIPGEKVMVLYPGVDFEKFSPSKYSEKKDSKVIGTVCIFRPEKRLEYFILAGKEILKRDSGVKFVIVGDADKSNKEYKNKIVNMISNLGLDKNFIFLGYRRDVVSALSIMDIFVLSSETEGMPLSLLEAMAIGIPVVAFSVGGIPEIIEHGKSGLLVEGDSPEELAESIMSMLKDEDLRARMGKEANRKVKQYFLIEKQSQKLEKIFLSLRTSSNK